MWSRRHTSILVFFLVLVQLLWHLRAGREVPNRRSVTGGNSGGCAVGEQIDAQLAVGGAARDESVGGKENNLSETLKDKSESGRT